MCWLFWAVFLVNLLSMVSEHRASPGIHLAHLGAEIWILASAVVIWLTLASPLNIQGQGGDGCNASHSNCQQSSGKLCGTYRLLHPSHLPWFVQEVQQSRLFLCPCCTDTQDCAVLKVRAAWKLFTQVTTQENLQPATCSCILMVFTDPSNLAVIYSHI